MLTWHVHATNAAIIAAAFLGPFLAVYLAERQRRQPEARAHKMHVFRDLMATRAVPDSSKHLEALSLIDLEFAGSSLSDRRVVEAWRLYKAHLGNRDYPPEQWPARRDELFIEMLCRMSDALGYGFKKAELDMKALRGFSAEADAQKFQQLWLEVLEGRLEFPVRARTFQREDDRVEKIVNMRSAHSPADTSELHLPPGI